MQTVVNDVERFQSEVNSVLIAEQLNADRIQELLHSNVIAKIDIPENNELQQVIDIHIHPHTLRVVISTGG